MFEQEGDEGYELGVDGAREGVPVVRIAVGWDGQAVDHVSQEREGVVPIGPFSPRYLRRIEAAEQALGELGRALRYALEDGGLADDVEDGLGANRIA